MKIECTLKKIAYDLERNGTKFGFFAVGNETTTLEKYVGKKVVLEIKNEKRSSGANGYLWVLLGELQKKLRIPKEELYRHYISGCGVYDVYCMEDKAVDTFIKLWGSRGLGWICDTIKSKIDGCTNVLAYRGTSEYSKEEMSVLLDQVVQDCIEQEIPTKKKEEIESLLEEYNEKRRN